MSTPATTRAPARLLGAALVLGLALTRPAPGASTATLSGTPRQACEATLCLSSGTRPAACTPSLQTYFSIKGKDPQETLEKRRDFLRACPSGAYAGREGHLDVLVHGQPLCDPSTLVAALNAGRYRGFWPKPSKICTSDRRSRRAWKPPQKTAAGVAG
jgi:hypothetical protein